MDEQVWEAIFLVGNERVTVTVTVRGDRNAELAGYVNHWLSEAHSVIVRAAATKQDGR